MSKYPEIKFEDIRKGDTIRSTYNFEDMKIARTGVVGRIDDAGNWVNRAGAVIAYAPKDVKSTIYLLDRPKPALPTEPGSVLLEATLEGGVEVGLMFLTGHKKWCYVGGSADPERIISFTVGKIVEADQK